MSKPAAPLKGRAARLARLMPSTGPSTAARTPFVLLVVLLLGGGLITLLLLNSALNEGSFRLSELKRDTTELTDEQQALQRDVDSRSQPDALERRARELGMVPGGSPAFLEPDGTVRGNPTEATAPPPSPSPSPSPTPSPRASAGTAPDPDATATGASTSASPSGSAPAAEPGSATGPDSATAPAAESTPPPTSPGR
ncbi:MULTISPECIES: FtsB family cell division protein [Streptomyces]|uniref:FtsB family cell division protein n=1 Tax=Streptomyces TaxID=1883 RepID=UPI00093E3D3E|nr:MULTISPECIES: septum formation initiator [unclassified Streptomyces]OKJ13036.1 septum formation initiator [Streptomyces sp. TSRI0261]QNQ37054.1 septum formation initiator [Streptomyces sp. CB00271]